MQNICCRNVSKQIMIHTPEQDCFAACAWIYAIPIQINRKAAGISAPHLLHVNILILSIVWLT